MSRSRTSRPLAAVLLVGAMLAGCSDIYYDRRETVALSAGDAVMTNRVTHMIDPWPRSSANRNIAVNGEKMQTAVERYRENRIIQPTGLGTSSAGYTSTQSGPAAAPNGSPTSPTR
jgi:hypothetical protein